MSIAPCIFCNLDRQIIAQSALTIAFFDAYPVSRGHALVIPRRHTVDIWNMTDEEYSDAFSLVRKLKSILQVQFGADAFNVGINCGEAAGQSVWHAHIHVIPRYVGDVPEPRGGVRNVITGKGSY